MAPRLGPLRIPWPGRGTAEADDPYWDFFINEPAGDHRNLVTEIIRRAPVGAVYPTRSDLHTPEVTSSHVKELARYLGADLVGIARLERADDDDAYPFGVVTAVRAEHDPRTALGVGGQAAAQRGLYVTFVLSAYIRELGYRTSTVADPDAERLAAAAGLGRLNADGKLVVPKHGTRVHVGDVIRTDLPLAADGQG